MSEKIKILVLGGNSLNIMSVNEAKKNGFYTIVADKKPTGSIICRG